MKNKYDINSILNKVKLINNDSLEDKNYFKLKSDSSWNNIRDSKKENKAIVCADSFFNYFKNIKIVEPENICRPAGDTTFFTTAGVQYIETILRIDGTLKKEQFAIAQPVIRSQFMDKVKDGVSTSFINFSVEAIDATPAEFIKLSNKFVKLIIDQGANPEELRFHLEELPDKWGDKKFSKTVLTVYLNDIELGECIYMHDYPINNDRKVNIVDIGFGVERLVWGINHKNYFYDFDNFYTNNIDSNKITAIIDSIRTAVLIAREGVQPSNHDHGYRLRQLSKRFINRNQGVKLDLIELVRASYSYWEKWGLRSTVKERDVLEIIRKENQRNWNSFLLSEIKEKLKMNIDMNINQTSASFLQQMKASLSREDMEKINVIIKNYDGK